MRSGFSRLCVNGWAVSVRVLRREPRGPHPEPLQPWRGGFFLTCWCGSGHRAIHDDPSGLAVGAFAPPSRQFRLAAHRGLFGALQGADSIAPAVARRCSQHSRQDDSPSWRTTGSALASPCLPRLRFCRQPERGAVLQRQQRVPHRLLQCDEPSLHRAHHDCCRKEQPEAPCRLTERGACGAADRGDALLR